jgi:hypothetical protein
VLEVAGVVSKPSGSGKLGSSGLPNSISTSAALGDPQRVVARLGHLAEQVRISAAVFR